jgi:hypothetical protein
MEDARHGTLNPAEFATSWSPPVSAGTIEQVTTPQEPNSIVLHDVSWEFYERFLDEIEEKSRVRLIYDDGELEIMPALQSFHENSKTSHLADDCNAD